MKKRELKRQFEELLGEIIEKAKGEDEVEVNVKVIIEIGNKEKQEE